MEILCCIIGSSASIPVYSDSVLSPFSVCINNEKDRKKGGEGERHGEERGRGRGGERSDSSNTYTRTGHGLMVATQQIQMPNLAPNRIQITKNFLFVCYYLLSVVCCLLFVVCFLF